MQEASSISLINVEIPFVCMSEAPTLVMIESITGILADLQGTKHPIWAIRTDIAIDLMNVLFPPMFGPVMMCILEVFDTIKQSFATQFD